MFVWFTMLLVLGLVHVAKYPHVLRCLNPYYAYDLLVELSEGLLAPGRGVPLHHGRGGAVQRPGPLRPAEHPGELDLS